MRSFLDNRLALMGDSQDGFLTLAGDSLGGFLTLAGGFPDDSLGGFLTLAGDSLGGSPASADDFLTLAGGFPDDPPASADGFPGGSPALAGGPGGRLDSGILAGALPGSSLGSHIPAGSSPGGCMGMAGGKIPARKSHLLSVDCIHPHMGLRTSPVTTARRVFLLFYTRYRLF